MSYERAKEAMRGREERRKAKDVQRQRVEDIDVEMVGDRDGEVRREVGEENR